MAFLSLSVVVRRVVWSAIGTQRQVGPMLGAEDAGKGWCFGFEDQRPPCKQRFKKTFSHPLFNT